MLCLPKSLDSSDMAGSNLARVTLTGYKSHAFEWEKAVRCNSGISQYIYGMPKLVTDQSRDFKMILIQYIYHCKNCINPFSLIHCFSHLFCNQPVRESPKLPKGTGFSRISIKRVSGVISSSFRLPSVSNDQPNSVFYTGMSGKCFL